ncbi:zinc-dependent alcohol dehydrogenase [Streptantibioticus ferralitis]|uniref:2-deoxy-scyllo-inosamine dehydrogenase n=1 Tax=Streptantibioticus ferralitis TaxID=236510 RepID=A0ABT5ZAX2_9ACTN|nr:alcohol dehydrogenase catalytic domain-containing protein [Streptantibioticus ferralitis]MDF2260992.1 alcohol dehydrogenase catalytic domain-containing protein [Streptantibioticus ferralitis]
MRAVVNTAEGIRVINADEPDGVGARLSVASAGICGTDVNFVAAGITGFVYGHEFAGVDESGAAYFVEPNIYGGQCEECKAGDTQRCTEAGHAYLGMFADGGMVETIIVPEFTLLELPEHLDVRDACLVEPGSIAWHALRRAQVRPGERLLVVGGGSIGLLAAAAARHHGLDVDLDTRHDHQTAAAERLGAGRPNGFYDVVLDAAGSESSLVAAAQAARPGGRIVSLGVYMDAMPIPGILSLNKELTYINSISYGRWDGVREVEEVASMLAENLEIAQTIITHRYPIADAREAFRVAADRSAGAIKVVIEP